MKKIYYLLAFAGIAILVLYIFAADLLMEFWQWIAGAIFGIATLNELKERSNKAMAQADEHEEIADHYVSQSVQEINQAKQDQQQAKQIAEDVTEPDYTKMPTGYKRESIKSQ